MSGTTTTSGHYNQPKPAAGPWQPGSTAPRDGRPILAISDGVVCVLRWAMSGYWEAELPESSGLDWVITGGDPSLWAPINLPEVNP
jgi:hypothetical protein